MSTRGSFILRKAGNSKEILIPYDAYPSHAGAGVVALIKSVDLDLLYGLLVDGRWEESDDSAMEPAVFSYEGLLLAVVHRSRLAYDHDGNFIRDSLWCEYAYVIDLDEETLSYFEGFKTEPQKGNPYGDTPVERSRGELCYPCHLKARFSLEYVRTERGDAIIALMQEAGDLDATEVASYQHSVGSPPASTPVRLDGQYDQLRLSLLVMGERLCGVAHTVDGIRNDTRAQLDGLMRRVSQVEKDVGDLEDYVALFGSICPSSCPKVAVGKDNRF